MSDREAPTLQFVRLVRGALAHMYDYAYLQNHPLASLLTPGRDLDRVTRAQEARRVLLNCIEALRPRGQEESPPDAARPYMILLYRYADGLPMDVVMEKLALSRRQVYREHMKGLQAVASLLWDSIHEANAERSTEQTVAVNDSDDRLEMARTEAARLQQSAEVESLDFQDVLASALELLAPRMQQRGGPIQVVYTGKCPPVVANRTMLRQALLNLLSHALDVIQGPIGLTVSHRSRDLLVDIHEFPQSTPGRAATVGMTNGVSLTVAQTLLEAQGCALETSATAGGPWRARAVLPLAGPSLVLVIDDNLDIVALFQRYLKGHRVSIIGVTNGDQATSTALELKPQVITLDVMMPNHDGWDILRQLQALPQTRDIPVIVCSVLNEPQLAFALGARGYITKPVSQVALLGALRPWLRLVPVSA